MVFEISKYQPIHIPEGTIYLGPSDKKLSIGFLRLKPKQKLAVHNRPVEEWLMQIDGTSVMLFYENDKVVKEVVLKRGDSLKIPAKQFHQHTNPENTESLTSWRFEGDITEIIENIRKMQK